jgi:type I restriction enzyme M protein
LFRGGAEGHIRQYFNREELLDAVIGLPANIFTERVPDLYFGFEEKRTDAKSILFIDASQHFEKVKPKTYCVKRILT